MRNIVWVLVPLYFNEPSNIYDQGGLESNFALSFFIHIDFWSYELIIINDNWQGKFKLFFMCN